VWIDGDPSTVPDGSSFAWQHWSHTFSYALAFTSGDWRAAGFNAAAEDYNHDVIAVMSPAPVPSRTVTSTAPSAMATAAVPAVDSGVPLLTVGPPNVSLLALKPRGNPLASSRPGTPPADGEITVRLREMDGKRTVARIELAAGIAAAREIGLLEDSDGAPLQIARGAALVELAPFGTVTVTIRPTASAAVATPPGMPPEAVQPLHARYWLHGKGPAPAGNVPVAVHLTPNRATLRPTALEGFDPPAPGTGESGTMRLTVACGPEPASGEVSLIVPDGLVASAGDAPSPSGTRLPYRLEAGQYASWDLAVRALPEAADGRYIVTARLTDSLGQELEDTALITVGEPGEVERDLGPEEQFFRMQADVMALAAEVDLDVLSPSLSLAPGASGSLDVRVGNNLAAELRGEVQVLSPFGSWEAVPSWAMAVRADAGGTATLSVPVTIPATAQPGWESWLVVKLMYFGRVRYSTAIRLAVS
jgi:hypothetical protein